MSKEQISAADKANAYLNEGLEPRLIAKLSKKTTEWEAETRRQKKIRPTEEDRERLLLLSEEVQDLRDQLNYERDWKENSKNDTFMPSLDNSETRIDQAIGRSSSNVNDSIKPKEEEFGEYDSDYAGEAYNIGLHRGNQEMKFYLENIESDGLNLVKYWADDRGYNYGYEDGLYLVGEEIDTKYYYDCAAKGFVDGINAKISKDFSENQSLMEEVTSVVSSFLLGYSQGFAKGLEVNPNVNDDFGEDLEADSKEDFGMQLEFNNLLQADSKRIKEEFGDEGYVGAYLTGVGRGYEQVKDIISKSNLSEAEIYDQVRIRTKEDVEIDKPYIKKQYFSVNTYLKCSLDGYEVGFKHSLKEFEQAESLCLEIYEEYLHYYLLNYSERLTSN